MSKAKIIGIIAAIIIAVIFVALISMYVSGYNSIQQRDERVKQLAADIDVQLQRRYDLIPNLVQSAKGYMQFERETLEQVTKLRSQWQNSEGVDKVATGNQLEQTLSKLILTYESYPDLKADSTITRLMDELAGTENRISVTRAYYNEGVRQYNLFLRTFPNNSFNEGGFLWMSPWGMQPYPTYETTTEAKIAPKVNLND